MVAGTKMREPIAVEADGNVGAAAWSRLYQAGGIAALITVLLIPIQLAVFIANPFSRLPHRLVQAPAGQVHGRADRS